MGRLENPAKYAKVIQNYRYYCKRCGRSTVIGASMDKVVCSWCGYYIYKNDKDEFKEKTLNALSKSTREEANDDKD